MSFLLFVHFFVLGVGVLSSSTSSGLERGLRVAIRRAGLLSYLQFLQMDLSYMFNWTYAGPADTDHFFEVDLKLADGTEKKVQLPEPALGPGVLRRRYQWLARRFAWFEEQEGTDVGAVLAQSVANSLVKENQAKSGTLRCQRHYLQEMRDVDSDDETVRNPYHANYYDTLYEAQLFLSGGELLLLKKEAASDAAPAASGQ